MRLESEERPEACWKDRQKHQLLAQASFMELLGSSEALAHSGRAGQASLSP